MVIELRDFEITRMISDLIMYLKILLHSNWLRVVQFKCNSAKSVIHQCKLDIEILDYDWLINNMVSSEPSKTFVFKSSAPPG